jgi:16S rRNA (guanine527-N7)-methyltransferase
LKNCADRKSAWTAPSLELEKIYRELTKHILEWNEKINVTAITDPDDFMKRNVEDSLRLVGRHEIEAAERILDMGTGGGFPGLPLAIAYPEKRFTLVDSVGKKLKVVADVAEQLGLKNVEVVHARAEEYASRETFDLVVSRAVAKLSILSEYCLPFVKVGGHFIAYKTLSAGEEIVAAASAIKVLGGGIAEVADDGNTENDHCFVIIKKIAPTPLKYPRKAGVPAKKPL